MIATLPGRPQNAAELALQTVDGGAEASGIHEIVVGLAIEIGDRSLEVFEFGRHARIIRTFVWHVQNRSVNLYSLLPRPGPPGLPPLLLHRPIGTARSPDVGQGRETLLRLPRDPQSTARGSAALVIGRSNRTRTWLRWILYGRPGALKLIARCVLSQNGACSE